MLTCDPLIGVLSIMKHPRFFISNHMEEFITIHRGSYMSGHVLVNLLNELRKRDKMSLINSIIQEHEC